MTQEALAELRARIDSVEQNLADGLASFVKEHNEKLHLLAGVRELLRLVDKDHDMMAGQYVWNAIAVLREMVK